MDQRLFRVRFEFLFPLRTQTDRTGQSVSLKSVNAILYIVSLSGYDECLIEDREANQMRESLVVFSQLVRNPLFAKVCISTSLPTLAAL